MHNTIGTLPCTLRQPWVSVISEYFLQIIFLLTFVTQDVKNNIHIRICRICLLQIIFMFIFVHRKNYLLHSGMSNSPIVRQWTFKCPIIGQSIFNCLMVGQRMSNCPIVGQCMSSCPMILQFISICSMIGQWMSNSPMIGQCIFNCSTLSTMISIVLLLLLIFRLRVVISCGFVWS